jgi:C4-type Zn-finger protein
MKKNKDKIICPKCGSDDIHSIEYCDPAGLLIPHEHQYDGTSEYKCNKCGYREGRWSGRELKGDDYERKYGG